MIFFRLLLLIFIKLLHYFDQSLILEIVEIDYLFLALFFIIPNIYLLIPRGIAKIS